MVGDYAYVAAGNNGLVIVNITNKSDPLRIGGYDTTGKSQGVVVIGGYAYVADGDHGLVIVDVNNKTNPQEMGDYDTDYAYCVAVVGDYAYIAGGDNGLVIVDVTNKTDPRRVGGYNTSGGPRDIAVEGDYAYVADFANGLIIVEMGLSNEKPRSAIDSISPNPALDTEAILFEGHGIDDKTITSFSWHSSINGELSTAENFKISGLGAGTHTIGFKVQDDDGVWSEVSSAELIIHTRPIAEIMSLAPESTTEDKAIIFTGKGTDDGTIIRYVWSSSVDGEIYNGSESGFQSSNLSVGGHGITLKVQDNHGVWSEGVSGTLIVKEKEEEDRGFGVIVLLLVLVVVLAVVGYFLVPVMKYRLQYQQESQVSGKKEEKGKT